MAYITQLKQQKGAITFAARRHIVNVLLSNRTFLIFLLVVLNCYFLHLFKVKRFLIGIGYT